MSEQPWWTPRVFCLGMLRCYLIIMNPLEFVFPPWVCSLNYLAQQYGHSWKHWIYLQVVISSIKDQLLLKENGTCWMPVSSFWQSSVAHWEERLSGLWMKPTYVKQHVSARLCCSLLPEVQLSFTGIMVRLSLSHTQLFQPVYVCVCSSGGFEKGGA